MIEFYTWAWDNFWAFLIVSIVLVYLFATVLEAIGSLWLKSK